MIVNQAFVRDFLGGADPIGKTLRTGEEPDYPSTVYEIVGVVTDSRYADIRGGIPPQVFAPATQHPPNRTWAAIMVRAHFTSSSDGVNTVLHGAIWLGWIRVLPSKPMSRPCSHSFTKPSASPILL